MGHADAGVRRGTGLGRLWQPLRSRLAGRRSPSCASPPHPLRRHDLAAAPRPGRDAVAVAVARAGRRAQGAWGELNIEEWSKKVKSVSDQISEQIDQVSDQVARGFKKFKDNALKKYRETFGPDKKKKKSSHAMYVRAGKPVRRRQVQPLRPAAILGMDPRRLAIDAAVLLTLLIALGLVFLLDRSPAGPAGLAEMAGDAGRGRPLQLAVTPPEYDDMGKLLATLGSGYQLYRTQDGRSSGREAVAGL